MEQVRCGCEVRTKSVVTVHQWNGRGDQCAAKGVAWADKMCLLMFADDVVLPVEEEEKDLETMLVAHRYRKRWRFQ